MQIFLHFGINIKQLNYSLFIYIGVSINIKPLNYFLSIYWSEYKPMTHIIRQIYGLGKLPIAERYNIVHSLIDYINSGKNLGWKDNRVRAIIPLSKKVSLLPLSSDEEQILQDIEFTFGNIVSVMELDTCLMFWQVTEDEYYLNIIQKHAQNSHSLVNTQANIILKHYMIQPKCIT